MQDWTFRVEDGKEIVHVEGVDYQLILRTIENYMAGYPDTVAHKVLREEDGNIHVRLGAKRGVLRDGEIEIIEAHPQTVWCQPLDKETRDPPIVENNTDGFVTG